MTCFACEQEPTQQCPRCGRPYCDDHGEELCDICLSPSSGLPSFTLYRGLLLALLVGTALAVWLLVQPTNSEGDGLRPIVITPTSAVVQGQATPGGATPPAGTTPATGTTPVAGTTGTPGTPTTAGSLTPRPSGTPGTPVTGTPGAVGGTYTVAAGDTLGGICANQRPALASVDCVARIRTLNNITGDVISIGDRLILP